MAEGLCGRLGRIVSRKRTIEPQRKEGHELRRCLNYWGVTSLGVGSTLGIGVYVVVGVVAMQYAGPAVLISFLIAAVASVFAGLCYAEFGARVPLAGSAFVYTYVTLGEFVAFLVGWNNILELMFGAASIARGLSLYVDTVSNHSMSSWFAATMPLNEFAPHFDLFAFLLVLTVGILLALGVRECSVLNKVLCGFNVVVILFIIILGAFKADSNNWYIAADEVPMGFGQGGFFPYGVWGMLKGAAICFFAFVGFDVVNSSGEEVQEPKKTIPLAILSVLLILLGLYAGVSTVVTMMVPYYAMTDVTSISTAFEQVGWNWAKWIIIVGAIFGITTSLFGSLFRLPRLLYSMASDGLFIPWFAKVSACNRSPIVATVIPTLIIATLAALLELEQLVLMMCIGTLASYTIVATCVILLRYRSDELSGPPSSVVKKIFGRADRRATRGTTKVVEIAMFIYLCICIAMALVLVYTNQPLIPGVILHVFAIAIILIMALQPAADQKLAFKTPLTPLIPCLSIYANIHLMVIINWQTWIRVLIWLLVGVPIYFMCICCYKQKNITYDDESSVYKPYFNTNGKAPVVQIVVEAPTPPMTRINDQCGQTNEMIELENDYEQIMKINDTKELVPDKDDNKVQEAQEIQIENNEEKEAKIIDLLDQVLQAEEDSYVDIVSLKDNKEDSTDTEDKAILPHRKSLSELSDAGSDVSGHQILSKYDVIAQVHREDLPKVSEEEEKIESNHEDENNNEEITAFNESETNSQTDESGYSDTIDRARLGDLNDENDFYIPVPPPMPPLEENYSKSSDFKKYNTMPSRHSKDESKDCDLDYLKDFSPTPPTTPTKFKTLSSRPKADLEDYDVKEPRSSVESNSSNGGDGNIRFGSDRQMIFMTKLNDIFQKPRNTNEVEEQPPRRRSHSTGNVPDVDLSLVPERPPMFLDLKKELLSREVAQNVDSKASDTDSESDREDTVMSRNDLKNKLENIFAVGGPQLFKPRLMKSNPPTPEDSYQTDHSSTESIPKLPKMDKNDTLKRQKAKFGEVLNSIRLSMNKDDEV